MPVHFGPAGYNRWVPKNTGLVLHPAAGAVAYAIIVVTVRDHQTHGGLGPAVGLSIALGVTLVAQIGALTVALTRSRRDEPAAIMAADNDPDSPAGQASSDDPPPR